MFKQFNLPSIPKQITFTIVPLALVIMGDSILYVILPSNFENFGFKRFLNIDPVFWIGFILSINRFVRFFSNIFASKNIKFFRTKKLVIFINNLRWIINNWIWGI